MAKDIAVPTQITAFLKKEISKEEAIKSLRQTNSFYNLVDFEVLNKDMNNPKIKWNIQFGQVQKTKEIKREIAQAPVIVLTVQAILAKLKDGTYTEDFALLKLKEVNFPYNVLSLKLEEGKLRWHIGSVSQENKMDKPTLWKVLADYKKDKVSKEYVLSYLKDSEFIYNVVDINKDKNNKLQWNIQYGTNSRDIASSSITSIGNYTKEKKNSFSMSASYGAVGITSDVNNDLSLSFIKLGAQFHRKLPKDLNLTAGLNATRFTSIDYVGGGEEINPSAIYPELSINLTKKFTNYSLSAGYSLLNYFVTNEELFKVNLKNTTVNRINGTFGYFYSDRINFSANTGFLIGSDDTINSGIDFSLSALYKIDTVGKYNIALSAYKSYLTLGSGTKDEGQGLTSTFVYNF